jgi:uridine kinase
MAIRVLLDHNVTPDNIIFASLIAAPQGLRAVANAFPEVKIVVSEVEKGLNEQFYLIPGIGNFGDRFYGTEPDED